MAGMETFVWDEHFTTGITSVDDQHRQLVHLINRLGASLIAGSEVGQDELQQAYDELSGYARRHFREEEALMHQAGLSARFRRTHHQHHEEFVQQLARMWSTRHSTPQPAVVLHGFLRAWLAMHILGEDQCMARQMAARRAGVPAEQAYEQEEARGDNATAALLMAIHSLYEVMSQQNAGLVSANQQLEARVAERTQALEQANQSLEALSNSDGLLGIANRRHFEQRLQAEWRRAAREHQALSLLMIDVDHFKRYNDHYGHPAGDQCLQAVTRAAAAPVALKRPADLLARYGGEELVVLLPDTPADGALAVAQDIRHAISALALPHAASPLAPIVTVSIGAATLRPTPQTDAAALVAAADAALYAAKHGGRNRVAVHAPE